MMVRRIVSAALALVAAAGLAVVAASPASAATHRFAQGTTNLCLDGFNGHRFADIYVTGCNSGNFQKFVWSGTFGARTQLRSLGVANHCVQNAGDRAMLEPCRNIPAQTWEVQGRAGSLVIRAAGLTRCLTWTGGDDREKVTMQPCGTLGSAWRLA